MNVGRLAKLIPYSLYLWLVALHQTLLYEPLSFWGVSIALPSLVVMLVAIHKSEPVAVWFGVAVMFLTKTGDSSAAAVMMIVVAIVITAAHYLKNRLNMDSLVARLTIVICGCFVLEGLNAAFVSTTELAFVYLRYTLPSLGYTSLVAVLFFMFKDGYITGRKVRALF